MSASYGLTLAGGIITLLVAIVTIAMGGALSVIPFLGSLVIVLGAWGFIAGIIITFSATKYSSGDKKFSTIALIFSILALITLQGFIIGPILSLIGAAMAHGESGKAAPPSGKK